MTWTHRSQPPETVSWMISRGRIVRRTRFTPRLISSSSGSRMLGYWLLCPYSSSGRFASVSLTMAWPRLGWRLAR